MKRFAKRGIAWLLCVLMLCSACAGGAMASSGQGTLQRGNSTSETTQKETGWEEKNGDYYYYQNGEKVKEWQTAYGEWYYFQPSSGKLQTGWLNLDGKKYHFDQDGTMDLGWTELQKNWYCFGYDGAMLTDWVSIGGTYYYFDKNGVMQTGWLENGGAWYYLNENGAMQTGWRKDNGSWYYFHPSGKMAHGESITEGGKKYTFSDWGGLSSSTSLTTTGGSYGSGTSQSGTVYVSNNGKIHRRSDCSGMKHYTTMTYDQAIAAGYVPCKKCY